MNRMMQGAIRHVDKRGGVESDLAREVLAQLGDETGPIPPFTVHRPHPEVLAAVWTMGRETWLAGPVPRLPREAVAAGVSRANRCPFCVEAHTMTMRVAGQRGDADVLRQGRELDALDEDVRPYVAWGAASLDPGSAELAAPPFGEEQAPWFVGTAVAFHYINRVVNVLLKESGVPAVFRPLGAISDRVADRMVGEPMLALRPEPGAALRFVPDGPLPDDCGWAAADPVVRQAVAGWTALFDEVGAAMLGGEGAGVVRDILAGWRGEAPELGKAWAEDAVAGLGEAEGAAARLTLLTALASFQVTDDDVAAFRAHRPSDRDLVGVVAFGAYAAARRIGSWLTPGS